MTIELTDAQLVERCRAGDAGGVERARRTLLALRVRNRRARIPASGERRRGRLSGRVRPHVRAARLAAGRHRDQTLARPADAKRMRRPASRRHARAADRGAARRRGRRRDRAPRRGAGRPRGAAGALAELPRDPRPLLRARRELPRRSAKLSICPPERSRAGSRAASASCARNSREENLSRTRLEVHERMPHTTRNAWANCSACSRRPRPAGCRLRRSFPRHAASSMRSSSGRARTRRSAFASIADLEAALTSAGYEPRPALSEALRARLAELDSA